MMEKKHTISVLVENEFGVLARIAGLFSSKGYNIDSLTVSETTDPTLSRMTIVTHGSEQIIVQIIKQLNKLVNVIKVEDLTKEKHLTQELCLVKLSPMPREESEKLEKKTGAKVLESTTKAVVFAVTGDEDEMAKALAVLQEKGVLEMARTGAIAIQRGTALLIQPGKEVA